MLEQSTLSLDNIFGKLWEGLFLFPVGGAISHITKNGIYFTIWFKFKKILFFCKDNQILNL